MDTKSVDENRKWISSYATNNFYLAGTQQDTATMDNNIYNWLPEN